jgi:hypothetical protein
MHTSLNTRGFTLFFALLVASLALSIGLAIYDITVRELDLSATVTQSQYAIYAADTGVECALYWDAKCVASSCSQGSAFATSSAYTGAANNSGLNCVGMDITNPAALPAANWTVTTALPAGTPIATTTFTINFTNTTPSEPYCATVVVAKNGTPAQTTITSHGYNTCTSGGLQVERIIQVSY